MLVHRTEVSNVGGDEYEDETDTKRDVFELRLAHFSVKEYLVSNRIAPEFVGHLAETTARATIATLCLTYLSDFDNRLTIPEIRAKFSFAQYCARYWMDHARQAGEGNECLWTLVSRSFLEGYNNFSRSFHL